MQHVYIDTPRSTPIRGIVLPSSARLYTNTKKMHRWLSRWTDGWTRTGGEERVQQRWHDALPRVSNVGYFIPSDSLSSFVIILHTLFVTPIYLTWLSAMLDIPSKLTNSSLKFGNGRGISQVIHDIKLYKKKTFHFSCLCFMIAGFLIEFPNCEIIDDNASFQSAVKIPPRLVPITSHSGFLLFLLQSRFVINAVNVIDFPCIETT